MTKAEISDLRSLIDRETQLKLELYQKQKQVEQASYQLNDFLVKQTDK